jgi:hypothetical protein
VSLSGQHVVARFGEVGGIQMVGFEGKKKDDYEYVYEYEYDCSIYVYMIGCSSMYYIIMSMALYCSSLTHRCSGPQVNNPEQYKFRPKEMLRDLCAIFALFGSSSDFQVECAKSGCNPDLLRSASKTCQRLNLLMGESLTAFVSLPGLVDKALRVVEEDEP